MPPRRSSESKLPTFPSHSSQNNEVDARGEAALSRVVEPFRPSRHVPPTDTQKVIPPIGRERRSQSVAETAFDLAALQEDVATAPKDAARSQTVLYLGYGSNMCAKTFRGQRGIVPLSEMVVVVPEIVLTFDLAALPYIEPCMANVRYRNQPPVVIEKSPEKTSLLGASQKSEYHKDRWKKGLVGVVYEVTKEDFATIIKTEGGGASYQDIVVDCYPLSPSDPVPEHPESTPFKAHTLYAPKIPQDKLGEPQRLDGQRIQRPDPSYAQPSARYLKLLTTGAEEHNFPQEYKDYLYSIRPYTITETRQWVGKFLFLFTWVPVIIAVFTAQRLFSNKKGRAPGWLIKLNAIVFRSIWASYDGVYRKLFGDGERTVGDTANSGSGARSPSPSKVV
ncbi:MAG: hypothetical protein M1824_005654 [Vezdaea acicularis]|nr:MAG: hypothetical protein M1824_005654 [Vezdaea acicularis]